MPLVLLQNDIVLESQVLQLIGVIPTILDGVIIFMMYNFAELVVEKMLPVLE